MRKLRWALLIERSAHAQTQSNPKGIQLSPTAEEVQARLAEEEERRKQAQLSPTAEEVQARLAEEEERQKQAEQVFFLTGTLSMPGPASMVTQIRWRQKLPVPGSHAHAARNHQEFVRGKVANLFKHTPDDKQINFVKEEVFRITDGNPIISPDHPVMVEMFGLPIVGALF